MSVGDKDRVKTFRRDGVYVVPSFLDERDRLALRAASDAVLSGVRARERDAGHVGPRISLLGSEQGERVAQFFGSPRICALLEDLGLPSEPHTPHLDEVHCYHEQTQRDWEGDWHRDTQFITIDPERERTLVLTTTRVHVRVALEDDDRLEIVRGSHARWDTEAELRLRKGAARSAPFDAARVSLRAGDACIFHAWSIHRATYRTSPLRRTLDAIFTFTPPPPRWPGAR